MLMTTRKSKKISLVFIIALFTSIFIYMFIADYVRDKTQKDGVFRIAQLEKIKDIPKNAQDWLIFKYFINGKEYWGKVYILDKEIPIYNEKLGQKCVVKMNKNKFINKIFLTYFLYENFSVHNSINEAPSEGWGDLPQGGK